MPRLAVALLVALVGVLTPTSVAATPYQESDPFGPPNVDQDIVFALVDEVWAATRLGLLDRGGLGEFHPVADLDLFPDPTPPLGDVLDGAELFAADVLAELDADGAPIPPELRQALTRQRRESRPAPLFAVALRQAFARADLTIDQLAETFGRIDGPGPAVVGSPSSAPVVTAAAGPASTAPRATTPPVTAAADASTPTPASTGVATLAIGAALATGLVAAALIVGRSRRGRRLRRQHDAALAVVFEAGRRLTASLDATEITDHAVDAVERATGARVGQLVAASEQVEPIRTAVDTGRPSRRRVDGADVVAVPCVGAGQVLGALVAIEPSVAEVETVLVELAGFVGPALAAADRHGSAADIDDLTRTLNRRRLDRDLGALRSTERLVSLVMLDIDHFKRFNDEFGHAAGDEVLQTVAAVIRASVRPEDVVYRYGGEEFCLLLVDTATDAAVEVCERVRAAVEATMVSHGARALPSVTVSAGVATRDDGRVDELAASADAALYDAKRAGRNRVLTAG